MKHKTTCRATADPELGTCDCLPRKVPKAIPFKSVSGHPSPRMELRATTRQREVEKPEEENPEEENHPRKDVYLRGLVDSMVAEIVGIARMEDPSQDDLKFASDQLTAKVEKFVTHLSNPPHPVGCMCKPCVDGLIADAG